MNGGEDAPRTPAVEAGIRRVPELEPGPLPESDPDLVEAIRAEIGATGPMTFARFMALALYDPEHGYYTRPAAPPARPSAARPAAPPAADRPASLGPGRAGDFLTAPEGHPIFGWSIARHLESVWEALDRPDRFVVREHGAGTGALAAGVLDGLRRSGSALLEAIRYQPTDASEARLEALARRIDALGLAKRLEPADDRPEAGAILANELLDALPVHRLQGGEDGELLEAYVGIAKGREGFETVLGPPSTAALAERLAAEAIQLVPGQQAEVCLAIEGWLAAATAPLLRGSVLLIDYGYPAAELYSEDRDSTLRAYSRHRVHADPFVAIGRQDLTAHVDLTAVARAAAAAGLDELGVTTQAKFLAAVGAGELLVALQSEEGMTLEGYLAARSALVRMLDPRATGRFAVLAFGRGLPADARVAGLA
jgi:SAM-dependent MidA family methyltransferase